MSANAAAVKALRKAREETPEEEAWEGLRLYGQGTTTKRVADPRVARLPDFDGGLGGYGVKEKSHA